MMNECRIWQIYLYDEVQIVCIVQIPSQKHCKKRCIIRLLRRIGMESCVMMDFVFLLEL